MEKSLKQGAMERANKQGAYPDAQPKQNTGEKMEEDNIDVWLKNFNEKTSANANDENNEANEFFSKVLNISTVENKTSLELKTALHGSLNSDDLSGNGKGNEMKSKESRKKKKKNKEKKRQN